MRGITFWMIVLCGSASFAADIVIYGSSPAAIAAAVQAKRMGKSAVVVSPETRIGGLTTGGLGQTDIGNKSAFGGIALEFYRAIAGYYADRSHWKWQTLESYSPDGQCAWTKDNNSMWTFEPSAALAVLEDWERRYALDIRRGEFLDRKNGVLKEKGGIVQIRTLSGNTYRGKVFIDATYEGDLMAAAGVSYTVGREANSVYGETVNGNQPSAPGSRHHNFHEGVSAHVIEGDPKSGLLPGVEPFDPSERPGDGDSRVQAYCFRMCLTDVPENRIPFRKPDGYDERDYELLFREYAAVLKNPDVRVNGCLGGKNRIPFIMSRMPNGKTDSNNRTAFSSDFIGRNWAWPEASYDEREKIFKEHLDYQRGLMWTLANHPRIPADVRAYFSGWGTCRDEFRDGPGDGWQSQLYVREARRMVGETVMTEHHCRGFRKVARPIAMAAYTMDSHHVRRKADAKGFVRNEGNVEDAKPADPSLRYMAPYGIDYGAIVPKRTECTNLIVPVCLSASHIAFGSIRMEPVFFALGQAAATAAAFAVEDALPVQDVPYSRLSGRLAADGQVVALDVAMRQVEGIEGPVEAEADFGGANPAKRVSVDVLAPIDLRNGKGLAFDFRCDDLAKFSNMTVYFRSGKGWYSGTFVPPDDAGWQRAVVLKRDMTGIEGQPSGWGRIDCMRVSGWRSGAATGKTRIAVSNLAYLPVRSRILVISGESSHGHDGLHYSGTFSRTMDAAGISHSIVSDRDLRADDFVGRAVAVLPYNGNLPDGRNALVRNFVEAGGRLVACYTAPDEILAAMGVRRTGLHSAAGGDLPFTGFLRRGQGLEEQPEFVHQLSGNGAVASPSGNGEVAANWAFGGRKDSGKAAIIRTDRGVYLSHVWMGGSSAAKVALMRSIFIAACPGFKRDFSSGCEAASKVWTESEARLRRLGRTVGKERFAVWCHDAYGPAATWNAAVSVMADAGATDLLANLCWGGHAYYRSSVLSVHPSVEGRGDAFDLARAACRAHGVRFHVWRVCGNLAGCPVQHRERLAAEGRLAVRFDGTQFLGWVCLSHPANIEAEIASMEEAAAKGADGVHLDYIRYRDGDTCFCDGCRERFERFAGMKVDDWPRQAKSDKNIKAKWNEFRRSNIDAIVRGVYRRVKGRNARCEVSAAVLQDWNSAPSQVGQDPTKWCGEGWLDFICPMDYTESVTLFANSVRAQKALAGRVPVLPGIGLSCWRDDGSDAERLVRQISAARAEGVAGWTLFDCDQRGFEIIKLKSDSSALKGAMK